MSPGGDCLVAPRPLEEGYRKNSGGVLRAFVDLARRGEHSKPSVSMPGQYSSNPVLFPISYLLVEMR